VSSDKFRQGAKPADWNQHEKKILDETRQMNLGDDSKVSKQHNAIYDLCETLWSDTETPSAVMDPLARIAPEISTWTHQDCHVQDVPALHGTTGTAAPRAIPICRKCRLRENLHERMAARSRLETRGSPDAWAAACLDRCMTTVNTLSGRREMSAIGRLVKWDVRKER